jgi:hypothetical protein
MKPLLASLPLIVPLAAAWAEKQEARILEEGQPLTESQLAEARRAGVLQPEKIRLLLLEQLPEVDHPDILFLAKQLGLFSAKSPGLAVGYGISLRPDAPQDRYPFIHQCVHVAQHERYGGIRPFLKDYLRECIEPGYPFGQLEQEAIVVAKNICKSTVSLPSPATDSLATPPAG